MNASATAIMSPSLGDENVNTGLNKDAREQIAGHLSEILSDTYMLVIKTHIYHWNVVGPMFHAVHEMTEQQYEDLFKAADVIAERIRALGFRAPLSDHAGPSESVISRAAKAESAHDMIHDLIDGHEAAIRKMRKAAELAEKHDDFVSHDMLVGRMTFHEQVVWMLRSLVTE